ncbi:Rne/Rng family ribonuclease [Streptomonospora salina]|uniref:Ribonuclease E n=2 Tax=Streptomonospora salina TaxID=104205 RepID=A0A841ED83_9ACTN|nr:Rne/Rng family ribonuclease [Streptomonospora salina]MBB6000354.1 ribonuclease E [Streptomonospora salina]
MLDNEPDTGAEGTEGTTETTQTSESQATTFAPQQDTEVKVSGPGRRSGVLRSAGPPPDPEPVAPPEGPLTTVAGQPSLVGEDTASGSEQAAPDGGAEAGAPAGGSAEPAAEEPARKRRTRTRGSASGGGSRTGADTESASGRTAQPAEPADAAGTDPAASSSAADSGVAPEATGDGAVQSPMVLFQPPVAPPGETASRARGNGAEPDSAARNEQDGRDDRGDPDEPDDGSASAEPSEAEDGETEEERSSRRRRRRGGRGRGRTRAGEDESDADAEDESGAQPEAGGRTADSAPAPSAGEDSDDEDQTSGTRRRRRRRRRSGGDSEEPSARSQNRSQSQSEGQGQSQGQSQGQGEDDPPNTVVRVREPRSGGKEARDEVQAVKGSTRLEAKKQRRREGREQGRRRAPVITESEFLARRESVQRDLVIRRSGERTQIAVLEDDVLVEHYVDRATHKSYVGNVYLGRVQNVLPSMEAAFVDIGKGRNAVLYAGEVNWDASGMEGQPKRIESVLKSGQSVLVQVTKDPMGHKGARLTSQISLPGRYLVYVPDGSMTGISRKLPDKERARLKQILKKVMPENAGVIVRTAAEGASEEELERDINRLAKQWDSIKRKSRSASAPSLLNSEPDLTVRVVRDVFNEDFSSLVVAGDEAWDTVKDYVDYVAPHLAERLSHWTDERDVFAAYRIDEQIAKALERKVWLPSGGSLIVDRTEAMTVVDVNTGKFTGQGGNLEETVTKNNLEAAEEIVRQLRLRDIGGIIVIDFIDMVLESNRDLVLRRLLECLSRDRTKHQVAEVTSLGLVQMTRKRVGQGLVEAFSHSCEHCSGRGVVVDAEPAGAKSGGGSGGNGNGSGGGRKKKGKDKDKDKSEQQAADAAEPVPEAEPAPAELESAAGAAGAAEAEEAVEEPAPAKGKRSGAKSTAKSDSTAKTGTKSTGRKTTRKKADTAASAEAADASAAADGDDAGDAPAPAAAEEAERPAKSEKAGRRKRTGGRQDTASGSEPAAEPSADDESEAGTGEPADEDSAEQRPRRRRTRRTKTAAAADSAVAEAT